MKKLVNQRFITAINFIISENPKIKKGQIAEKLNIGNSAFSEILKERMNAGIEVLALLSKHYNFSLEWLINGDGEKLKPTTIKGENNSLSDFIDETLEVDPKIREAKKSLLAHTLKENGVKHPTLLEENNALLKENNALLKKRVKTLEKQLFLLQKESKKSTTSYSFVAENTTKLEQYSSEENTKH